MILLLTGVVIFFGVHLIPGCPAARRRLVGVAGELPYKIAFASVALGGLGLMVAGFARAPLINVWQPPASASTATAIFMAPALILLPAANFNGNIKRIVRHPMSLAVLVWSLGHLLANGDLAALLLFGGFALFALFDMRSTNRPAATDDTKPATLTADLAAAAVGIAAYILLAAFHKTLFGVAVF